MQPQPRPDWDGPQPAPDLQGPTLPQPTPEQAVPQQAGGCDCGDVKEQVASLSVRIDKLEALAARIQGMVESGGSSGPTDAKLRELTIAIQRLQGEADALKRDRDTAQKNAAALEKTVRESILANQNQTVEIQRFAERIQKVENMAGTMGFVVRLDQKTGQYTIVPKP
jgi:hypothetical protein